MLRVFRVGLLLALMVMPLGLQSAHAQANAVRPNVLLIITDDQSWSTFNRTLMPGVHAELVDKGILFKRGYVSSPICCPARAEVLTGLYEHHTGVDGINGLQAGRLVQPTITEALRDAGYRTMFAGKFLNNETCDPRPEYDRWMCTSAKPSSYTLRNPLVNIDGEFHQLTGYTTDLLATMLGDAIAATPAGQPFFAIYSPTSPHLPADEDRYRDLRVPLHRPPSFNEDTPSSGKPAFMRRPPLAPSEIAVLDGTFRVFSQAVRALDDSIVTLLSSLGPRADDTLVFYLSDNGHLFGEHRSVHKRLLYEESAGVPFIVRDPRVASTGRVSAAVVQNIDISPTIAAQAGLSWVADGVDLTPLIRGEVARVRDAGLLEVCQGAGFPCNLERMQLMAYRPQGSNREIHPNRTFAVMYRETPSARAVVTERHKLIEYVTGESELYDLGEDPYEMRNLAADPAQATLRGQLRDRLAGLVAPPAPTSAIFAGPSGELDARYALFKFHSHIRGTGFSCRLVNHTTGAAAEPVACDSGSHVVGPLADGDYTFEVTAVRGAARQEAPTRRAFAVRGSAGPRVQITSAPAAEITRATATVRYSSSDEVTAYECRLVRILPRPQVQPWAPCDGGSVTHGPLSDAVWAVEVRGVDLVGQRSLLPAAAVFRVDRSGPTVQFLRGPMPAGFGATNADPVEFVMEFGEPLASPALCAVDGGAAFECGAGPLRLPGLGEGRHGLQVTTVDRAGNRRVTTREWIIDRTPPVASLNVRPSAAVTPQPPHFYLASSDPPIDDEPPPGENSALPASYRCSFDGAPYDACWGFVASAGIASSPGPHELAVRAVDSAGNVSAPVRHRWVLDPNAPPPAADDAEEQGGAMGLSFAATALLVALAMRRRAWTRRRAGDSVLRRPG